MTCSQSCQRRFPDSAALCPRACDLNLFHVQKFPSCLLKQAVNQRICAGLRGPFPVEQASLSGRMQSGWGSNKIFLLLKSNQTPKKYSKETDEQRKASEDSGVQTLPLPPQLIHNVNTEVRSFTFYQQFILETPRGALYLSETQTWPNKHRDTSNWMHLGVKSTPAFP